MISTITHLLWGKSSFCAKPSQAKPALNVLYCRALPRTLLVFSKKPSKKNSSPHTTFFTVHIICTAFSFLIYFECQMLDGSN